MVDLYTNQASTRITIVALLSAIILGILTIDPKSFANAPILLTIARVSLVPLLLFIIYLLWEAQNFFLSKEQPQTVKLPDFLRYFYDFGIDLTIVTVSVSIVITLAAQYFPNDLFLILLTVISIIYFTMSFLYSRWTQSVTNVVNGFWHYVQKNKDKLFSESTKYALVIVIPIWIACALFPISSVPLKMNASFIENNSTNISYFVPQSTSPIPSFFKVIGYPIERNWSSVCFSGNGSAEYRNNGTELVEDKSIEKNFTVLIENISLVVPVNGTNCTTLPVLRNFSVKYAVEYSFSISNNYVINTEKTGIATFKFSPRFNSVAYSVYAFPDVSENADNMAYTLALIWALLIILNTIYSLIKKK